MRSSKKMYVFMSAPAVIILLVLTVIPIILLFLFSFTSWNIIVPDSFKFNGVGNYLRILSDRRALNAIKVSFYYVIVNTVLQVVIGFAVAYLLYLQKLGTGFLRSLFLIPMMLQPVVVGLTWRMLLTPNLGGLNYFIELLGINAPAWLATPETALVAVTVASVWEWTPFVFIVLLAGLESLPAEPLESARIDGAGEFQTIRFIIIPMLKPTFLIVIIFRIIESLGILPVVYVMTGGGPANATEPINLYAFNSGIDYLDISYASSLLIVYIFILLTVASFFIIPALKNK